MILAQANQTRLGKNNRGLNSDFARASRSSRGFQFWATDQLTSASVSRLSEKL